MQWNLWAAMYLTRNIIFEIWRHKLHTGKHIHFGPTNFVIKQRLLHAMKFMGRYTYLTRNIIFEIWRHKLHTESISILVPPFCYKTTLASCNEIYVPLYVAHSKHYIWNIFPSFSSLFFFATKKNIGSLQQRKYSTLLFIIPIQPLLCLVWRNFFSPSVLLLSRCWSHRLLISLMDRR
jgi:hypothetical protein